MKTRIAGSEDISPVTDILDCRIATIQKHAIKTNTNVNILFGRSDLGEQLIISSANICTYFKFAKKIYVNFLFFRKNAYKRVFLNEFGTQLGFFLEWIEIKLYFGCL